MFSAKLGISEESSSFEVDGRRLSLASSVLPSGLLDAVSLDVGGFEDWTSAWLLDVSAQADEVSSLRNSKDPADDMATAASLLRSRMEKSFFKPLRLVRLLAFSGLPAFSFFLAANVLEPCFPRSRVRESDRGLSNSFFFVGASFPVLGAPN